MDFNSFKTHPYYDENDDLRDWIEVGESAQPIPEGGDELEAHIRIVRSERERLISFGTKAIRTHLEAGYAKERPYLDVQEVLFRPTSSESFRVYIECFFNQYPDKASPDTDYWWVIINCPMAMGEMAGDPIHLYATDLGYYVA